MRETNAYLIIIQSIFSSKNLREPRGSRNPKTHSSKKSKKLIKRDMGVAEKDIRVESEWQEVKRRRAERGDGWMMKESVTFFFRNFPDYYSEADLWKKFKEVGNLFIPAKKDKKGNRFGFVRFLVRGKPKPSSTA